MSTLPPGLEPVSTSWARGFAVPRARAWVRDALEGGTSLYAVAAGHPGAREMSGRGPVYVIPGQDGRWVVRRYHRGGLVAAPLLGDRYLRGGEPRPVREARASAEARRRGIPTPEVVAGAVYPSGPFYRGDLVTAYIAGSSDLAAILFEAEETPAPVRTAAMRETGSLIARMATAGVEHPDLNARNVLLAREGDEPRVMLLDLDRCRVHEPPASVSPRGMLRRLERSLRKIGRARDRPVEEEALEALRGAVEAGS